LRLGSKKVKRSIATVIREAIQAGYELLDAQDFVKADGMDYFPIFTPKPD
jgi:hypothetical protein